MFDDPIGPVFLATLSLAFCGYGVWELTRAWRLEPLDQWIEKALPGAGSLTLGVLFALCSYRLIAGTEGLSGVVAWMLRL